MRVPEGVQTHSLHAYVHAHLSRQEEHRFLQSQGEGRPGRPLLQHPLHGQDPGLRSKVRSAYGWHSSFMCILCERMDE